ncbi:MAG: DUF6427 family protein [Porphyromonadaceae bacterium]|nr:DUF6427 family protein [Porphyromonadaceae bacterium]
MYAPSRRLSSQSIVLLSIVLYGIGLLLYALPLEVWREELYNQINWPIPEVPQRPSSSWLEFAIFVPVLAITLIRLADFFVLLDKYEQRLSLLYLPLLLYIGLHPTCGGYYWPIPAGVLGVLGLLLGSYQKGECPSRMVLVGALLGLLGLSQAKVLLLLPILLLMLYRLRSLSLRNLLATLHGLILSAFIATPVLYLADQDYLLTHLRAWGESWQTWSWPFIASGVSYPDLLSLVVVSVFLFFGIGMHYIRAQGENVRQREQEASLMQLSIGGLICATLSAESFEAFYFVISIPSVILLARGMGQLRDRAQHIALSITIILLLITALLH